MLVTTITLSAILLDAFVLVATECRPADDISGKIIDIRADIPEM